jgi:DNA-directed RNA polymerase specialized sigma24 family protein
VCRSAFDSLDRQWAVLARSREGADALSRWSGAPELAAADLNELVERIWAASAGEADVVLAALARRAARDVMAARTLLHALRPGLRYLGRRFALGGSDDLVDHEILALAWERIRTYPADRRPRRIAANVLLDVRKLYLRQHRLDEAAQQALVSSGAETIAVSPSAEDVVVDDEIASLRRAHARLAAAVDAGAITPLSARVVWRTRVQQYADAEVAEELGVAVRSLQRRRQRAERELALAG